ncbi:hypothetical protein CAFE_15290 [Caprobacter fermentans]|uniref:DUF4315 family protein n=1 Tax=Caproicibacter fermentans TaxID=2576756 RepID=A0A6N8HY98_9FIRM|nr:hypothetical protein [Caproicibacter fermentans]MVB10831.1 hypothetical protein [Caproicibacter fermentans]OCN03409.1 hypothetical protein A7X67_11025 [Clostridium sp. W14A]
MSERIESLNRAVERDEQKIQKLQETIKARKEKIRELENAEILSSLNSLSAQGVPVKEIIAAIGSKDADTLMELVAGNEPPSGSGTGSAFQTIKEDMENG